MPVLIVFAILIIGFSYTSKNPVERIRLKRSGTWENYAILGVHGFEFAWRGLLYLTLLSLILGVVGFTVTYLFQRAGLTHGFSLTPLINNFVTYLISLITTSIVAQFVIFFVWFRTSLWLAAKSANQPSSQAQTLQQLKQFDSFLNIVLTAMDTQTLVKISLKSRKIYIGTVFNEQFEQVDFDNIAIIPHLSGYRDKDTLRLTIDCNYTDVYKQYNIMELNEHPSPDEKQWSIADFCLNIKVSEIESISLFYLEAFDNFPHNHTSE